MRDIKLTNFSCSSHPHNTYVQILSETGIIGFLFLIYTFIYLCYKILKHLQMRLSNKYYFNDFEICVISGIIIYFWPLIPTGNIFNNWLNILMFLNLPLLIWSRTLRKPNIND
jgi:O-antigen ligase